MPLLKYFGFVGSALLLLLLGLNWLLPEPETVSTHAEIDKSVIRISSIEMVPEKVVFDTSLPTIVPPPTVVATNATLPQSAFSFVQITPGPLSTFSSVSVVRTAGAIVKSGVQKKEGRQAAKSKFNAATNRPVPVAQPLIRLSLIDAIRSRFGQSFFKLN